MEYGGCALSSVPLRREADSSSEMTSQLLFGEVFKVVGKKSYFLEVLVGHDGYRGWVDGRQCSEVGEGDYDAGVVWGGYRLAALTGEVVREDGMRVVVVKGARLPGFEGGGFRFAGWNWRVEGEVIECGSVDAVAWAIGYQGAPYLWGGRSPFGLDCSGLVQVACGVAGTRLARDAGQMLEQGLEVGIGEARDGDLVFTRAVPDGGMHVGMVVPGGVIHASARVRIDRLGEEGILCGETGLLTHRMLVVRRMVAGAGGD